MRRRDERTVFGWFGLAEWRSTGGERGGDGTLTVVHEDSADKFSVVQNAQTQKFARTMALDPNTHDVYLVTAEFDEQPAAEGQTRPRRTMKPDRFTLLVMSQK